MSGLGSALMPGDKCLQLYLIPDGLFTKAGSLVKVMDLIPLQADVFEFVGAGVSGFILKDASITEFLKTIRTVNQGIKVLPTHLTGSLFSQIIGHAIHNILEKLALHTRVQIANQAHLSASYKTAIDSTSLIGE